MKKSMWIPAIFGDGMVLQRNHENVIYGRDAKAKEVSALISNREYTAQVQNGEFRLVLPPSEAASGLTLEIRGSERAVFSDVCFGDVFMLSGQSNMQLPVSRVLDVSEDEVKEVNLPFIRHFTIEPNFVFDKAGELRDAAWTRAVGGEVMNMSAAGFFFARELYKELGVPIGLALNAQGGSTVEAWMPAEELDAFGDYGKYYADFLEDGAIYKFMADCDRGAAEWYKSVASGEEESLCRAIPDGAKKITLPQMTMGTDLDGFSGSVWFYKEFSLDATEGETFLYVGELVDSDRTYINGNKVGETFYRYPPRKYPFNSNVLKKGKNLIAVRLVIEHGAGGFIPEHEYFITAGGKKTPLSGEWKYFIEKRAERECRECILSQNTVAAKGSVWLNPKASEGFLAQHVPTGLYNASLLPLMGIGFKAVLWYQGESNAGAPYELHPQNKAELGKRLARAAKDLLYNN